MCQYLIGGRKHWFSTLTGQKGRSKQNSMFSVLFGVRPDEIIGKWLIQCSVWNLFE
jgi:hypothetical protein